jgi:succinate dehydrogenase/fumarate reductase cytochrome b subunit
LTNTGNEKTEVIISGILHIIFGLIFLFYSLGASILFFITDKLLQKKSRNFKWVQAVKSLFIPVTLWLIFMGIVWVEHLFLLK